MRECHRCGARLLRDGLGEMWCTHCGTVTQSLPPAREVMLRREAGRSRHQPKRPRGPRTTGMGGQS